MSRGGADSPGEKDKDPGGSIGKAIAVIRCFIDGQDEWGVRELAAALSQPASSVHRLLRVLMREGLLAFDPVQQKYRVGMELYRIGSAVGHRMRFGQIAEPVMKELVDETGESVWLATFDADDPRRVVYVEERAPPQRLRQPAPIGRTCGIADDVAGLAVLAFLGEGERARSGVDEARLSELEGRLCTIRLGGYAIDVSDDPDPVVRIAAPTFDGKRRPNGAVVLAVPSHRFDRAREAQFGARVAVAADRLSHFQGAQLLGGAGAGSWHDGLEVIGGLMRPHVSGMVATPSLGGGARNLDELQDGRGAYCMTTAASLRAAYEGLPPFRQPHDRLRAVMNLSRLHLHIIVRASTGVGSFRDLRRLRLSPGLQGFSTSHLFDDLLALAGVSAASIRRAGGDVVHFDYPEARRQFEAGHIDAMIWLTGLPNALYRDLAATGDARLVPLDRPLIEAMAAQNPAYEAGALPAGMYQNQPDPVPTLGVRTVLATTVDRDPAEVRAVTQAVFERRQDLVRVSSAYGDLDATFAQGMMTVPVHSGARDHWDAIAHS